MAAYKPGDHVSWNDGRRTGRLHRRVHDERSWWVYPDPTNSVHSPDQPEHLLDPVAVPETELRLIARRGGPSQ